jgi:hypothetical protein
MKQILICAGLLLCSDFLFGTLTDGKGIIGLIREGRTVAQKHAQFLEDERRRVKLIVARSQLPTPRPVIKPLACEIASHGKPSAVANYYCSRAIDEWFRGVGP